MAEINFGRIKIDSLKVIIPLTQVEVVDGKFNQEYVNSKFYQSTGEVTEVLNRDTNQFCSSNGIKVKLEVVWIKFGGVNEKDFKGEEFLVFQPSSKFLKENYFDGISLENLPVIYDYLIGLNIVHFSYQSLLNARFADVDFCLDFISSMETFESMVSVINSNVLPSLQHFAKPFNKKFNSGLQFNQRKESTPTRPFLKFYHKSTELLNNSNEFYFEYLKDNYSETIAKGIGRYEITLKNSAFKKHYKVESITVEELLNISSDSINNMFHSFLPNYLEKGKREKTMGNTPTEIIHMNFINRLIELGESEPEILFIGLKGIDEKVARSRSKKMIENLLQKVNNSDLLEKNNEFKKELNEALKVVGFYRE